MKKADKAKGFTLLEMVISMSVSLVALGMILTLALLVNQMTVKSQAVAGIISDISSAEKQITEFFYSFDSTEYLINVQSDRIIFTSDTDERMLCFSNKGIETAESVCKCDMIHTVEFEYDESLSALAVTLKYKDFDESSGEYRFLLFRHSENQKV